MLLVLTAIGVFELAATHLMLLHAATWVRALVDTVSVAGLALLLGVAWSVYRWPVLVTQDTVVLVIGWRRVTVPLSAVSKVSALGPTAPAAPAPTRSLALLAAPNAELVLSSPLLGLRGATTVRLRVDDPAGFASAVTEVARPADA